MAFDIPLKLFNVALASWDVASLSDAVLLQGGVNLNFSSIVVFALADPAEIVTAEASDNTGPTEAVSTKFSR